MTKRIAVIDFPPKGKETSWFVVNDRARKGDGGLVRCINEHGFEAWLIDYKSLDANRFDPNGFLAVFYASGWTQIRHPEKRNENPDTKEINPSLLAACEVYDKSIEAKTPVVAFTHGSQILTFYTGGNYFNLSEKRAIIHRGYKEASDSAKSHWLLNEPQELPPKSITAREHREYRIDLRGSQFQPLVNPDDISTGPAIAVHKNPDITAILLMIHPEYDKNLSAYKLMDNIFAKIGEG